MSRWLIPLALVGLTAYLATSVLAPFIVAAAIAYLLSPLVDWIGCRTHLPRLTVVVLIAVVLLMTLAVAIWLLEVRLSAEIRALRAAGPDIVQSAFTRLVGSETVSVLGQTVDVRELAQWTREQLNVVLGRPADALQIVGRAIDGVARLLLTLLALFYFLLDGRRISHYLQRFIPPDRLMRTVEVAGAVHAVLGRFLRGQLLLVGLMIVVNYLLLDFVFGLPYALPIAILSGILEAIPLLGPILAGAIAAIVALSHSGIGSMIGVIIAYLALRQIEDQLVMPIVVGRALNLHPLVPIVAVLMGGAIGGVLGAVLAVPAAAALRVTLDLLFPEQPGSSPASQTVREPLATRSSGTYGEATSANAR